MTISSDTYLGKAKDILTICECCGQPIWKANHMFDGEMYVDIAPDEFIHVECVPMWVRIHQKEAK